jgi:hypothetical protein
VSDTKEMDDGGDAPPSVPYGTHIWHLPTITMLSAPMVFSLFRAPKLLDYKTEDFTPVLQLKELMLFSPLLQKVHFVGFTVGMQCFRDEEHSRTEWKKAESEWLNDLVVSHSTGVSKGHSLTSIWPSLTHYHAKQSSPPLSMLQITILPIVNQLRQVTSF